MKRWLSLVAVRGIKPQTFAVAPSRLIAEVVQEIQDKSALCPNPTTVPASPTRGLPVHTRLLALCGLLGQMCWPSEGPEAEGIEVCEMHG